MTDEPNQGETDNLKPKRMSSKLKVVDGFVWLIVTEEAKEIFMNGLFELYILHDDSSESKVEGYTQLLEAIEQGSDIAIEGGYLTPKETQLDLQQEVVEKSKINIVACCSCESVFLHRITDDAVTCPYCSTTSDPCNFTDLNH